jgi:hypothetical protein
MKILRRVLLILVAFSVIGVFWFWWDRPQKVDMASYVPADSLLYIEGNSLPEIVTGLTGTDAWKALAPAAGLKPDMGQTGLIGRFAAITGIGTADLVIVSRAQVAFVVLGFATAGADQAINIRPRAAVVIETHTSEGRTRSTIERRVGEFAQRAYGNPDVHQEQVDGVTFETWSARGGDRGIVTAVTGSLAIIGNDESTVKTCLAVKRGERPSLAGNSQLEEMRRRVGTADMSVFGYLSTAGAAQLLEVAAPVYVGQMLPDPRAQSFAATLLPQIAKLLGGAGWSARFTGGGVEDRYFFSFQGGAPARLHAALVSASSGESDDKKSGASNLLPAGTDSVTRYDYRRPEVAWDALNAGISSQLPALLAAVVTEILKALVKPYGIDDPAVFLPAVGPELVTARLDQQGERAILAAQVRDEKVLRELVYKRLGTNTPRTEMIGDASILASSDPKRGAASFVDG